MVVTPFFNDRFNMHSMDQEIYEANKHTVAENQALTEAQSKQIDSIVDRKIADFKKEHAKSQTVVDYLTGKLDPNKQNYDEAFKVGAQVVENNPVLYAGFEHADNKPNFLYEVGIRELAYQKLNGQSQSPQPQQQAPQTQANLLPNPQFSSSPYQGAMAQTSWNSMTESQFLGAIKEMGLNL